MEVNNHINYNYTYLKETTKSIFGPSVQANRNIQKLAVEEEPLENPLKNSKLPLSELSQEPLVDEPAALNNNKVKAKVRAPANSAPPQKQTSNSGNLIDLMA